VTSKDDLNVDFFGVKIMKTQVYREKLAKTGILDGVSPRF